MHQQWHLFLEPTSHHLYHITSNSTQLILPHEAIPSEKVRSNIWSCHYISPPPQAALVPVSPIITHTHTNHLCHLSIGTPIPSTDIAPPKSNHVQHDGSPHPFYKSLMRWDAHMPTTLRNHLESEGLCICGDGAYLQEHGQGSHGWVFSTRAGEILWSGSGPAFGHNSLMTPYCAELSGLITVLFILH